GLFVGRVDNQSRIPVSAGADAGSARLAGTICARFVAGLSRVELYVTCGDAGRCDSRTRAGITVFTGEFEWRIKRRRHDIRRAVQAVTPAQYTGRIASRHM